MLVEEKWADSSQTYKIVLNMNGWVRIQLDEMNALKETNWTLRGNRYKFTNQNLISDHTQFFQICCQFVAIQGGFGQKLEGDTFSELDNNYEWCSIINSSTDIINNEDS